MLYKPVLLLFIRNKKKTKLLDTAISALLVLSLCLACLTTLQLLLLFPFPPSLPSSLCVACVSSDKGTATVALPLATGSRKC